jgi:ABC-type nitrate/sulfonate/bicarbonate transport system substrate-binding protein
MIYKSLSVLLGLSAAGLAQSASSAELPTLRYAQSAFAVGIGQLPLTIAAQKGFFAREGLHVELVKETRSNASGIEQGYLPALERGGSADMAAIPNGQFVEAVLNGSHAVAVAVQLANPVYSLIVRPEIKTFADLKGKEITLTAAWDAITLTTRQLLAIHGIGPSDVRVKSIGGTEGRFACLKAGECAATSLGQPADFDATKMGYHRLGTSSEVGPAIFNMEVVTSEWAKENKDTLVRYLRADADAMRFIHDPKNRDEVARTVSELTHEPPDAVNEMMANFENPNLHVLTKHGEVDMPSFRHVLDLIKGSGLYSQPMPPAEHFVDLSYAKAAGIE